MELRQLRHFLAVLDHGGFSGAAIASGVSQQALSKSIAALEHGLGVRLFDRDTRNLALTTFGDMLVSHARNMDAEAQQYLRHLDDTLGVKSGRLIIGTGPTSAGSIVAGAVQQLTQARPKLKISVIDGAPRTLTPMLLRGEIDVMVCVLAEPLKDPLLAQEVLFHDHMRLFVGAAHPLSGKKAVTLMEARNYPWMTGWMDGGLDSAVTATFTRANLTAPVPAIDTTSIGFARTLLAAGTHLAVLPEHVLADERAAGSLTTVDLDADLSGWQRPVTLTYRRNSTRAPATMAFVTQLYRAAEQMPPISDPAAKRDRSHRNRRR